VRLCVRPQRRVNCASHRSQAKAVLSTGTHCMCPQVLHRTFVPRTTVSALLMTANNTTNGPKITTTDWQTRSAGDEEVTTSKPGGSMVGTTGGDTEHWFGGCVVERCPLRVLPQRPTHLPRSSRIRLPRSAVAGDRERQLGPSLAPAWPGLVPLVDSRRQPSPCGADQRVGRR
jgi:hypothetical protein